MKKEMNTILILMTLGGLLFNGCASRSIVVIDNNYKKDDYISNNYKTKKYQAPKKIVEKKPFSWEQIQAKATIPVKIEEKKAVIENGFKSKLSSDFQNPKMGSTAFGKVHLYGTNLDGKRTASGDIFNLNQKTVAHKSLPFNTMLQITNLENNKSETVRVNDRGRFSNGTILNISPAVAQGLGIRDTGDTSNVKVEILGFDGIIVKKNKLASNNASKDCVDCVVSVPTRNSRIVSVAKPTKSVYSYNDDIERMSEKLSATTYEYKEDLSENSYRVAEVLDASPLIESFSEKTAIQIGAFRQYAGAKVYAKKYDLLSNQYKVEIKENVKDDKTLYRVRIEGFPNEFEAKEFIARYGLTGAFLVRK